MKTNNIQLLIAAAALLLLTGCAKELGLVDAGSITVDASIGQMTKLSYTSDGIGTSFTAGDKIAVYGWIGSAGEIPNTRVVDGVVNTFDGSKWTPESQMLWKNVKDAHYFLGVYPVHAITNFTADAYTLDPAKYTESDLLIATNLDGVKASQGPVALTFDHAMAKLTVNLKFRSEFGGTPSVSSVTVSAKSTATVDYLTKTVTATGSAAAVDVPAATTVPTGYALTYSGLQVPQEGVRKVTITIDSKEFVFTSDTDIPLKGDHYTTLNLLVGRDKIELGSISVNNWEAGTTLPDADAVEVEPCDSYLTFTTSGSNRISISHEGGNAPKLYYSYDTTNWTKWDYSDLEFSSNAPLYLYGDNADGFSFSGSKYSCFHDNEQGDSYEVFGDIMSLLKGNTSLTKIPNEYCFCSVFCFCSKMTRAPELPATTLAPYCYECAFKNCTSLTDAPELPATTLVEGCYESMFNGCTNLNYIKCMATDISAGDCLKDWVGSVGKSGTFVRPKMIHNWRGGACGIPFEWYVQNDDGSAFAINYLTFTSTTPGTNVGYLLCLNNYGGNNPAVYYSYDKTNWMVLNCDGVDFSDTKPVYVCGYNPDGFSKSGGKESYDNYGSYSSFEKKKTYNGEPSGIDLDPYYVSGDIMSLISKDQSITAIPCDFCFYRLFYNLNGNPLSCPPSLPATTLTKSCYKEMFQYTYLSAVPEDLLPASTMQDSCYFAMFSKSKITTAPLLPSTKLAAGCYQAMFDGSDLKTAPVLPATTLANRCYQRMLSGCAALTKAPDLPAMILTEGCYWQMFSGCTSLGTAPDLPATTLAEKCYWQMFSGCTSLGTAPDLPATTLKISCYTSMFSRCTSLHTAPKILPATTLEQACYNGMFYKCENLTVAPELPAPVLASACYYQMFYGCKKLQSIKCLATNIDAANCVTYWVTDIASSGTFVKDAGMNDWTYGISGIPENWTVKTNVTASKYLTFTSEGTTTISLHNKSGNAPVLYYSTDHTNWTNWDYSQLSFTSNSPLYLCGDNPGGFSDGNAYSQFVDSGSNYSVSGDIMSLLDKDNELLSIPKHSCFYYLFQNCRLTEAPALPATFLTTSCYYGMFCGCGNLKDAPVLPATALAFGCYEYMFDGCASLQTAPELPATTLEERCYRAMFQGCDKLQTVPLLPAAELVHGCYENMFSNCFNLNYVKCLATDIKAEFCTYFWMGGTTSSGTFVKAAGMNDWPRGEDGIPDGWTIINAD